MSATNHTTNYELPIFIGTDKPAWLVDWNGAMSAIDTAIKQAETKADSAGVDIGTIQSDITTINSALTTLNGAVSQLRLDTNANTGSINTINELIGNGTPTTSDKTIIGAINEIYADITGGGTDVQASNVAYDNNTSGLTATNVNDAIDEVSSYSSTETVVGTYLGKPRYRKVIQTSVSQMTADYSYLKSLDISSIGIDKPLSIEGIGVNSSTSPARWDNLKSVALADSSVNAEYSTNLIFLPNTIQLLLGSTMQARINGNVEFTIEYTKTADL